MLKGEMRKKQILETAEALFTERGYEATGVQDILNVLHLSKGSFYHHFESKAQVLQTICENRAQLAAAKISKNQYAQGLQMMNDLLRYMIPFQGEGLQFLKMILPVFTLPEGKSVRFAYQEALKRYWLPLTENAFFKMIKEGQGFSAFPHKTAEIALDLVNDLWGQICDIIISQEKKHKEMASPLQVLNVIEPYRPALENILSAPYGSIELINLEDLKKLIFEIHLWWMVDSSEFHEANPGANNL